MRTWWPLGWACNLNDIFIRFPYEKCKSLVEKYRTKQLMKQKVKQVFREGVNQILLDIVKNNDTFKPHKMGYQGAEIHMEPISGDNFINLRKNGKFGDVDFLKSNFTGYQMYIYINGKRDNFLHRRKFPIYVNAFFRNIINQRTNEGKGYG